MPLFVEMESMGESLSKEDFCAAAANLYQVSRNFMRWWLSDFIFFTFIRLLVQSKNQRYLGSSATM